MAAAALAAASHFASLKGSLKVWIVCHFRCGYCKNTGNECRHAFDMCRLCLVCEATSYLFSRKEEDVNEERLLAELPDCP